jgi:hypothetical protein
VCCSKEFTSVQKTKSIALSPRGMVRTYYDIITYVFREKKQPGKVFVSLTPVKEKYYESRIICESCGVAMKNAFVALEKVAELLSDTFYILSHILHNPSVEVQTDDVNTMDQDSQTVDVFVANFARKSAGPKTPVRKKILNAYTQQVARGRMHNAFEFLIKDEMDVFSSFSSINLRSLAV